ncbi:MAG: divergent polysaccharide deacetylase family protein, partial [Pseudomonadota bacterium]|nr:divergent polysaccharide deacetylase family protein [Pseudomonadota bacterium]
MRYLALLVTLLLSATALAKDRAAEEELPPVIAIIIDDMGHNLTEGERLIRMDQPLTLAFLPFRRHTVSLARYAHRRNK